MASIRKAMNVTELWRGNLLKKSTWNISDGMGG
jgi:hypothetical protein